MIFLLQLLEYRRRMIQRRKKVYDFLSLKMAMKSKAKYFKVNLCQSVKFLFPFQTSAVNSRAYSVETDLAQKVHLTYHLTCIVENNVAFEIFDLFVDTW